MKISRKIEKETSFGFFYKGSQIGHLHPLQAYAYTTTFYN